MKKFLKFFIATFFLGNTISAQVKLSEAIKDAVNWLQMAPPSGCSCRPIIYLEFKFHNDGFVSLIGSNGQAMLQLASKAYTFSGTTTSVKYLKSISDKNSYLIFNPSNGEHTWTSDMTYYALSNNSMIQNPDILEDLFTVVYVTSGILGASNKLPLSNLATVSKSGTNQTTIYTITQEIGPPGHSTSIIVTLHLSFGYEYFG